MNTKKEEYTGKKYLPLKEYLKSLDESQITLSFEKIKGILKSGLPPSAYKYEAWWTNNRANGSNADHSNSWLESGWEVKEKDLRNERITFKNVRRLSYE